MKKLDFLLLFAVLVCLLSVQTWRFERAALNAEGRIATLETKVFGDDYHELMEEIE